MVQVQKDAKDARYARTRRTQPDNRSVKRAARAANCTGDERTEKAQVHTEDRGFRNAHERRQRRGQGHGFEFFIAGLDRDRQRRAALRHIRRTGQRQPERQAVCA